MLNFPLSKSSNLWCYWSYSLYFWGGRIDIVLHFVQNPHIFLVKFLFNLISCIPKRYYSNKLVNLNFLTCLFVYLFRCTLQNSEPNDQLLWNVLLWFCTEYPISYVTVNDRCLYWKYDNLSNLPAEILWLSSKSCLRTTIAVYTIIQRVASW